MESLILKSKVWLKLLNLKQVEKYAIKCGNAYHSIPRTSNQSDLEESFSVKRGHHAEYSFILEANAI